MMYVLLFRNPCRNIRWLAIATGSGGDTVGGACVELDGASLERRKRFLCCNERWASAYQDTCGVAQVVCEPVFLRAVLGVAFGEDNVVLLQCGARR